MTYQFLHALFAHVLSHGPPDIYVEESRSPMKFLVATCEGIILSFSRSGPAEKTLESLGLVLAGLTELYAFRRGGRKLGLFQNSGPLLDTNQNGPPFEK